MRKSNTWTIVSKEFARFFGDRQLLFTTVIMPGLLIYIIYSLMGSGMARIATEGRDELVTLTVENMPASLSPELNDLQSQQEAIVVEAAFGQDEIDALGDKDLNAVLLRFPPDFDQQVDAYLPASGLPAPNVEIYHNSANNASARIYAQVEQLLTDYEASLSNRFDVNRADSPEQSFDQASMDDVVGDLLGKLLPMLIVMMIFSGVMSIAPSAIAGEKERGTIATLLVTPMRRNELALGKIVSLSALSLLSGISSFVGIVLSLPKMIHNSEAPVDLGLNYTLADYASLLAVIFATVLIMSTAVSLLSALARDTKNASTMVMPLMLVVMLAGLMPMFQSGTATNPLVYLIPFYNGIESMAGIFAHEASWSAVWTTVVSDLAYTALGVWGLTRMFNSEKIMFSR